MLGIFQFVHLNPHLLLVAFVVDQDLKNQHTRTTHSLFDSSDFALILLSTHLYVQPLVLFTGPVTASRSGLFWMNDLVFLGYW